MTQVDLQTKLDAFIAKWNGKKASYEGYPGECLSLVKQWVDVLTGQTSCAPLSGDGYGDGYYANFPAPLPTYFRKEVFDSNKSYPAGSLIAYPATHHIAIVVSSTAGASTTEVFEQNANPDGSPAHLFNRPNAGATSAQGVLVPIVETPAPINHVGQSLHLSASVDVWHIYPLGVEPVLRNALKTTLNPAKFGGLTYAILANPYPNTYTIQTEDFGKVNIYADKDASIS